MVWESIKHFPTTENSTKSNLKNHLLKVNFLEMYSIKVEVNFSAAHNLRGYKGKCEDLHGHNWKVEIIVEKSQLDKIGMVMDFRFVRDTLNSFLERFDHKYLNEIEYFKKINPTSENIAKYIFSGIKPFIPGLKIVTVWESENSSASYY